VKERLIDVLPFKVEKSDLHESVRKNDGRLIVKNMIIQRANTPNKNRRIYSKNILERETSKLIKGAKSSGAPGIIGELDHPDCFRPSAQILTQDGWKFIKDVTVGETVLTLNTDTGNSEWEQIDRVVNESYSGKMISFKAKNIDTMVTPNHRFFLLNRSNNYVVKTAQEIVELKEKVKVSHLSIPTVSDGWSGTHYDVWKIDKYENVPFNATENFKSTQGVDLVLNAKAFFGFLGFYLAEGYVSDRDTSKGYKIIITQNKGEKADKFQKLLTEMSPDLNWIVRQRKDREVVDFECSDARLWTYLSPIGNKYTKFIPDNIKNASSELLQELLDWFVLGDGTETTYQGYSRKSICSVSKQLIEDFNEILVKLGMCGVIKIQEQKSRVIEGREINLENCSPLYRMWFKTSKAIHIDFRFLEVSEVQYNDTVHCVTVPNGTFYARDNGFPFWTGNSSTVSLKNACIGILDYRWNGNDQLGDIEILPTPSGNILRNILEAGYVPGISSRGMGSVRNLHENDDPDLVEVEDDFEMVTWDAVSDPSTHNAYFKELKEGRQLAESFKRKHPYQKASTIMQDIICSLSGVCCLQNH
jgi:hypothetical protein